ncbi:class I SAM-dependent methyltransferase [Pelagibacterium sp. 26DY04]|uniref:class I SAM-dependent methyltransferase n=1 Tax=Pelagibacterium sp. 26DY04 TaxID=2967130 RepID=UPI0028155A22|nr:class I SAM-dependent methyltransferase [Pelagibacterium sp. 26DY04]WMT86740.1 class I SAM-dependent methyltransferase [Pelagibacterium sp. 26DY04]
MSTPGAQPAHDDYILGHSERELARLEQQAALFAGQTRDILLRAGLEKGMRVLDLGCGVGDVSLIAAEIVGPQGSVTGIDPSEAALSVARARAHRRGFDIAFEATTLEAIEEHPDVDAVIGRFILLHMTDPGATIAALTKRLKPGTLVNFIEFDITSSYAEPALPLLHQAIARIGEVYRRSGRAADMGARLYPAYRAAGLTPEMIGLTRISNRDDVDGFAFIVESTRSLLPAIEALGIATAVEIDIDTLHQRLLDEARAGDPCIFYPRLVGAWARVS